MKNFMIILMLLLFNCLSNGHNVRRIHETSSEDKKTDAARDQSVLNISHNEAKTDKDSESDEDERDDYKDEKLEDLIVTWLLSENKSKDDVSPSAGRSKRSLHYYMHTPPPYTIPTHGFGQMYFPPLFHPQAPKKRIYNTIPHFPSFERIKKLMNPLISFAHGSIKNMKKLIHSHKMKHMENHGNGEHINVVSTQQPDEIVKPEDNNLETVKPTPGSDSTSPRNEGVIDHTAEQDTDADVAKDGDNNESEAPNDEVISEKPSLSIEDLNNNLIPKLVKEEVARQLETILEKHEKQGSKNTSNNTMDDKKNSSTVRDKNKSKHDQQNKIQAKSIFGNFIGNERFANIFVFYPSKDGESLVLKPTENVSEEVTVSGDENNDIVVNEKDISDDEKHYVNETDIIEPNQDEDIDEKNDYTDITKEKDVEPTENSSNIGVILETTEYSKTTTTEVAITTQVNEVTTTESVDSEEDITPGIGKVTTTESVDSEEDVAPGIGELTTTESVDSEEDVTPEIGEVTTTESVDSEEDVTPGIGEVITTERVDSEEDVTPGIGEVTTTESVDSEEDVTPGIGEETKTESVDSDENITPESVTIVIADPTAVEPFGDNEESTEGSIESDIKGDYEISTSVDTSSAIDIEKTTTSIVAIESSSEKTTVDVTIDSNILEPTEGEEGSTEGSAVKIDEVTTTESVNLNNNISTKSNSENAPLVITADPATVKPFAGNEESTEETAETDVAFSTESVDSVEDVTLGIDEVTTTENVDTNENITPDSSSENATLVITADPATEDPFVGNEESAEGIIETDIEGHYKDSTSASTSSATNAETTTYNVTGEKSTLEIEEMSELTTIVPKGFEDKVKSDILKSKNSKEEENHLLDLNLALKF